MMANSRILEIAFAKTRRQSRPMKGLSFQTALHGSFYLIGVDDSMHMADALISPAVGATMLAVSAGAAAYSVRKIRTDMDEQRIPLMGVMGAFVFAAQMINFSIPATGSSGHLGGGMLLAALLGPQAGFLTMAAVLLIQALFFGDGGLLAYGANVFNLGFYTCMLAYPLIYRPIMAQGVTARKILVASAVSTVVALQLGAFSVVLETVLSGQTELPFATFIMVMQPIHLAIGTVEGLVTAAVITFIWRARPELIDHTASSAVQAGLARKKVVAGLLAAAMITAGGLSLFASSDPDGLEWSIAKTAGTAELEAPAGIHQTLATLQSKISLFPDYTFKANDTAAEQGGTRETDAKPADQAGTSVAGIAGGLMTLILAGLIGLGVNMIKKHKRDVIV